ncbi:MAG TPA: nucleoside monophosphate kinase [Acidimicrobiales bacterium]|nr:nucleoside monophosphate kinase [Acidimicrobiales bacterium]
MTDHPITGEAALRESTTGARVIVLGRQGSGKGTQCARLSSRLGVPHISTGDLLRAAIAAGAPIGAHARAYVERGLLVPDEVVLDLVAARLAAPASRSAGYLLDGFPRTLAQAQALFEVLGDRAADVAVEIDVPAAAALPRLIARRVCDDCGALTAAPEGWTHHLACPACGGIARRRDDDTDEAIARRLALYDEQSTPLLVWLDRRGALVTVDGLGSPDEVFDRLLATLEPRLAQGRDYQRTGTFRGPRT